MEIADKLVNLEKTKKFNILISLAPYLFILAFSIIGAYTFFYDGFPKGDDYSFHFSNILDLSKQLESGNLSVISSELASGYGVGKQLFYSPLSHISCAILYSILNNFGVSFVTVFKLNIFITIYVSNIFTYILAHKISKNRMIALVCASIFAFYPYRMFDIICRVAYAEGYAYMFIPIFFLGLYELVHLKDVEIKPLILIIIGAAGLYLSHNITALFTYTFGLIFIVCYYKEIFKLIKKNKLSLLYAGLTFVITLAFCSKVLFSSFELLRTNYYNVSYPDRMWTSRDYLVNRSDSLWYSGFLNFSYWPSLSDWVSSLGGNKEEISNASFIKDIIIYLTLTVSFVIIDKLANRYYLKKYHLCLSLPYYLLICLLLIRRLEVILAVVVFMVLYLIYLYLLKDKTKINKSKFSNVMAIFVVVTFLLIFLNFIWYVTPSVYYTIQFPWRIWTLFSFFLTLYIASLLGRNNKLIPVGMVIAGLLLVMSQPLLEKRIQYTYNKASSYTMVADESAYQVWSSTGANMEYYPHMYYWTDNYESAYTNSLYPKIKSELNSSISKNPYKYDPILLEGNGDINVLSKKAPVIIMELNVEEDNSLIQMPLIYYKGYEIIITNLDTNKIEKIKAIDTDGLVSFRIDSGNYKIETKYAGTTIQTLGLIYFNLGMPMLMAFYILDIKLKEKDKYKIIKRD